MTNWPKFRKRQVVVRAQQFDGSMEGALRIAQGCNQGRELPRVQAALLHAIHGNAVILQIGTLQGTMRATRGDWVIEGLAGEIYPCKPEIFAQTYDAVADAPGEAEPTEAQLAEVEEWADAAIARQESVGVLLRMLVAEIRRGRAESDAMWNAERQRIISVLRTLADYPPGRWGAAVGAIAESDPELLAVADEIASKAIAALDPGGRAGRPSTACECKRCREDAVAARLEKMANSSGGRPA